MGSGRRSGDPCRGSEGVAEPSPVTDARLALVTGGAGFIGSNLVELLLALGFTVRVFDNLSTGHEGFVPVDDERVEFMHGDVRNFEEVQRAMGGVAVVFHLAAMSKVAPSLKDPSMVKFCLENNVIGGGAVTPSPLAAAPPSFIHSCPSRPPIPETVLNSNNWHPCPPSFLPTLKQRQQHDAHI
jgi:hypothetical protein